MSPFKINSINLVFMLLPALLKMSAAHNNLRALKDTAAEGLLNLEERVFIESARITLPDITKLSKSSHDLNHTIMIACKLRNMDKLMEVLNQNSIDSIKDHLTQQEVENLTYDATSATLVKDYLRQHEIFIDEEKSTGNLIVATSTIKTWQSVFDNEFYEFEVKNDLYHSTKRIHRALGYSLPKQLVNHIDYIHYLIHFPSIIKTKPLAVSAPIDLANGNISAMSAVFNGYVTPQLIFNTYQMTSNTGNSLVHQAFFGSLGQKYSSADLAIFQNFFQIPAQSVVDSYGAAGTIASPCDTNIGNCNEASLDAQYLMAVAQSIPTHYNYEDDSNGSFDWNAWLETIVAMSNPPSVISISYAGTEPDPSSLAYFNSLAMILASRGVTLIAAAGDDGAHSSSSCSYNPLFPASSQYVTAVGATMGPESSREEVVCSSSQGSAITSGGGFSNVEPVPSWQQSFVANYFNNVMGTSNEPTSGYATTGRGYPDVSLLGNHYLVVINNAFYGMDGSSASTPVFAGMVALVNAARRQIGLPSLGWLNPILYANSNSPMFHDIVTGDNKCGSLSSSTRCTCSEGFAATTGWDPASGLGSINFPSFLSTLTTLPPTSSPTRKPTSKLTSKPTPKSTFKKTVKPTKPTFRPTIHVV